MSNLDKLKQDYDKALKQGRLMDAQRLCEEMRAMEGAK